MMRVLRMRLNDVSEDDIYTLVGHTLAGRGYDDYESGLVKHLKVSETIIDAEMAGRSAPNYTIKVWCDDDGIDGNCTCPYSQGFDVCQHVAAVLFKWVYERVDEGVTEAQLRQGLERLSKSALADLLMEAGKESPTLYHKLSGIVDKMAQRSESR